MNKIDYQKVLRKIRPDEEEKKHINSLATLLIQIVNEKAEANDINAQAVLVGSVAKGTWISGKADIDIFIRFPLDTPLEILKNNGLKLGLECIKEMNGTHEYRYASHPYITGSIDDLDIDFVPCYDIRESKKIKSAVDRTIPHTEYIKEHLMAEESDEVLLLKCFMKTVNTYGSEFKVGGFAGYLCELLILHYQTFINVLENASDKWKPGYKIDLARYGTADQFNEPLIVVDPVDANRNVAAALSLQKMSEFTAASGNFLKNQSPHYFEPIPVRPDHDKIKESFKSRGTKTIILTFKAPDIPADALYPQINK
ncbi:MAG TPA: CCA tRNA nucleotidyltransferase, partial [Methanobacterium sp.]|nr:CCA tRNA nucleotidyltransferase [Methanobacterium sp.]